MTPPPHRDSGKNRVGYHCPFLCRLLIPPNRKCLCSVSGSKWIMFRVAELISNTHTHIHTHTHTINHRHTLTEHTHTHAIAHRHTHRTHIHTHKRPQTHTHTQTLTDTNTHRNPLQTNLRLQ